MKAYSAGILLFRFARGRLEVLLVHPGGPYWANKDDGVWSIPKGLCEEDESPLDAAKREFSEETGFEVCGEFLDLGELRQASGKIIHAWAVEQDIDAARIVSNTFSLELPRKSGVKREYPEVDRGQWFGIDEAGRKILGGQAVFIDRLVERVKQAG
jgi:predicted NUDIX family NTP pyrophosphohydrolase